MNARMDTQDACDLRFGQVGIANVRIKRVDAAALCEELERRVRTAPQLFARAAVVLDLSHLLNLPDDGTVDALLEAVRSAGMLPVGLAYGTSEVDALSQRMGLPLIAKFRAAYEPADGGSIAPPAPSAPAPEPARRVEPVRQEAPRRARRRSARNTWTAPCVRASRCMRAIAISSLPAPSRTRPK